jgi:signal transduction histidine kinase/DNA-binding response OmpR family regulator/ligand-binding sensor domain-containing protein
MPETSYYGGIHSITKDSIGRIWFSGYDALFVYNGHSFIQMNDLVTRYSPGEYWTYGQVITDKSKRLYVATNHGLLRFNYQTQKFDRILEGNIGTLLADEDGSIWLVRNNKIESFHPDRWLEITKYPLVSKLAISALITTQNNTYVASKGKVYRVDKKAKQYHLFADLGNTDYVIRDLIVHHQSTYILTHSHGLFECDQEGKVINHYKLSFGDGKSTTTKGLYLDAENILWVATQSGLFLVDPLKKETHLLRSNLHYPYSLPNNSVWSIYPDPDGGIWIGMYGGKLAYMTFFDNDVNFFKPTLGGLNHPIVSCFEEDGQGNLWIGTEGGGVNYWDRKTDHFSYYTQENNKGLRSNMIKSLHYNKSNKILHTSAFNGGMARLDNTQGHFIELFNYHSITSQPLSVYDFEIEGDSGIWMTDPDAELIYKNTNNGRMEVISLCDANGKAFKLRIEALFRDQDDRLWLITHTGLYIMNVRSRRIVKHHYIASAPYAVNNLCSYSITSDSAIWFGTRGGGVNRLDKEGSYINFSEKEGLLGKTVFGILEDTDSKNVWFSTNDGLYYYEHVSQRINKFPIDVTNLCGTFYVRSCFKTSKGEMLFGGTNGFIMFTPRQIKQNNQKPKVFITDLLINNKKVAPRDEGSPLKQDIATLSYADNKDNKIALSHKQSNIEIRVSSNSYLQAEKNCYAYRMLGLSDKWYKLTPGQKSVQFFDLPSGTYIFQIKAANNDGLWGTDVTALRFQIKPSPFLSIWAYMIYSLVVLFIIYFIWRYFTNKKIFKHRLEMEQIKEQNMKELTQARINFFTHISHDLKTPLTLVLDPLKQLKETLLENRSATAYIHLIEKNVKRIQRMISQLLQFREIESQKITINQQLGDIVQYIGDIFSLFELYVNKKGIEIDFKSEMERFYTKFDHDIIEKIFTNLFSNAIKYTTENGFVGVKISRTGREELAALGLTTHLNSDYISVAITNTGVAIPDDKKEVIFESFNRLTTEKLAFEKSTGLGLAIVKKLVSYLAGKVSLYSADATVTFTVILPFTANAGKTDSKVGSYEYTIAEIDNILAESEEMNLTDKQRRKANSIVVIEDDPGLRAYMEQRLSERYNVYATCNGYEGIAKTEKIFPQIVITDLMMPEADGFDVCRKLRSNIKTSHVPIVVLSALGGNTENKIKALESGANIFIDKPFDMDYLLKQVDNLIKNQQELKESYSKKYIAEPSKITISSTDEDLLKRAMEHIEKNLSNIDYNVESFVADMRIGRTLLYQKINDILGMSIKEFILDIRLKRGAQLLEQSDLTVSEISYLIGFNNPKYFSICFKKQFEVTPTEFRKAYSSNEL